LTYRLRLPVAIAVTFVVLALVGTLRPDLKAQGVPRARFWTEKSQKGPDFDLVVAGDSRTYRGVSPRAMQEVLSEQRIMNFGFSGVAFTPMYLDAATRLLGPDAKQPTIVLGITPIALTRKSADSNSYLSHLYMTPLRSWLRVQVGSLSEYLRTISNPVVFWRSLRNPEHGYFEVYYTDGWVSARKVPEDPGEAIEAYLDAYDQNRVDPAILSELYNWVRNARATGIRVYGLRVPTSPAMVELERARSGFEENRFVADFSAAGGIWLPFINRYHSYDGSHLREDSAQVFSRDLAEAIAKDGSQSPQP
jgi:hypothetical protein